MIIYQISHANTTHSAYIRSLSSINYPSQVARFRSHNNSSGKHFLVFLLLLFFFIYMLPLILFIKAYPFFARINFHVSLFFLAYIDVFSSFLSLSLSISFRPFFLEIPLGSRSFGPVQHQVNALVTNAPCSSVHNARTCDCPSRTCAWSCASHAHGPNLGQASRCRSAGKRFFLVHSRHRGTERDPDRKTREVSSRCEVDRPRFMDSGSRPGRASHLSPRLPLAKLDSLLNM